MSGEIRTFSFPFPDYDDKNDETPSSGIVDEAHLYAKDGRLGSAVSIRNGRIYFEDARSILFPKMAQGPSDKEESGEVDLPDPEPFTGPYFDVFDYLLSPEYTGAKTDDEAVEIRGELAFAGSVRPDDFSELPEGIERVGIATLWSQSTWGGGRDRRNEGAERVTWSLKEGDVLAVSPLPPDVEFRRGENWNEIRDWGFGFYRADGTLLPFSAFHDYDLEQFLKALLTLESGQALACVVRSTVCNGGDGVKDDPEFNWRVYSCEVTVLRVTPRLMARRPDFA